MFTLRPLTSTNGNSIDAKVGTSMEVVPAHFEVTVGESALIDLAVYGIPVSVSVISQAPSELAAFVRLSGTELRFEGVPVGLYELVVMFSSGLTLEITATVHNSAP